MEDNIMKWSHSPTQYILPVMSGQHSVFPFAQLWNNLLHKVKKVKCTLVQALWLCTGCTAHRGNKGIALPFLDQGTRRGWGVSVRPWPLFTPGKDPVPIVQEAGWAPELGWTDAENLAPTGIRYPDRTACSQSLYQLRYPAHNLLHSQVNMLATVQNNVLFLKCILYHTPSMLPYLE
jgi:hypothetical protein